MAKLHWRQRSNVHEVSTCGRFTVNRAPPCGDSLNSQGYLAWARALMVDERVCGFYPWAVLGCFQTQQRARLACEEHAEEVFRDRRR